MLTWVLLVLSLCVASLVCFLILVRKDLRGDAGPTPHRQAGAGPLRAATPEPGAPASRLHRPLDVHRAQRLAA